MSDFGSVQGNVVRFKHRNGSVDEIDRRQITAVRFEKSSNKIIGALFVAVGVMGILGFVVQSIGDSRFAIGPLLIGAASWVIGYFLYKGRVWIRLETTSGQIKSRSLLWWQRTEAEAYVNAVRSAVFQDHP